ncbi:MAG: UDP binding domain-containing protein, partial [Actinomycetota bacterium]|nr:UDP binding domain-containing protein [Actinomycetota bacterium]
AETAYRDLNIALAHELGDAADRSGIDFSEVRTAANSQPESDLHIPGVGVGGHCIPVYPYLFMHGTPGLELIAHGRELNEQRPHRYAAMLEFELGSLDKRRIVILGAAYRPEIGLVAHSSVFDLIDQLTSQGALVEVLEPFVTDDHLRGHGLTPGSKDRSYDAALIHTGHQAFRDPAWHGLAPILVDGRGLLVDNPPKRTRYLAPGFRSG